MYIFIYIYYWLVGCAACGIQLQRRDAAAPPQLYNICICVFIYICIYVSIYLSICVTGILCSYIVLNLCVGCATYCHTAAPPQLHNVYIFIYVSLSIYINI